MARPPGCQLCCIKAKPNGRFINARPNGRFIKAEATGWPDLQTHNQFISGRAKLFSAKAAQWPFYQRQAQWPFYQWVSYLQQKLADGCFINARPNGRFINARPNSCFIKAETTDGQTCRFQQQVAISLLSRTINLSAAGPSNFQQKPAQWPFYQRQVQWPFHQRQAQWPFYQGRSNRMARLPDFSNKLQCRYYPAQSSRAKLFSATFFQRQAQWPC